MVQICLEGKGGEDNCLKAAERWVTLSRCLRLVQRQLGRFESRANFGTWLYRIVSNCSVDLMRSKQARHDQVRGDSLDEGTMELPAADVPGPERMAQSAEIDRRVQDALQELSPLERAAFTLRHYEGRTIDEICATLGLGTSAAKHSVFRAVKKLRLALAPLRSQES
jgi:RNA polymerase sigma-70 factor (ECF subfamily)